MSAAVARMIDMSDKNYIAHVRTMPTPSRPQDATTCASAIIEIDSKLNRLEQIHESLTAEGLLFERSTLTLKPLAKEQLTLTRQWKQPPH